MGRTEITIVNQNDYAIDEKSICQLVRRVYKGFQKKRVRQKKLMTQKSLTLVFLNRQQMQKINRTYRGKDKPTDVLSFAPIESQNLGELLFCVDVLQKQARDHGHSLQDEFLYMLIHGLLHLLGYDHELSQAEEKIMFKIQDGLFQELTEKKINLDCFYVNRRRS